MQFKKLSMNPGMYKSALEEGMSLSEHLEQLDPSTQYTDTRLDASRKRVTDTARTGNWGLMLGNQLKLADLSVLSDKVLSVDSRFALEQVTEKGSMIQDEERVADGQWDAIIISIVTGFGKMFDGAVKQLDYAE